MVPSDRSPLSGRWTSETKPTTSTGELVVSLSAVATSSMWRPQPTRTAPRRGGAAADVAPGADGAGAPAVAGRPQQRAGDPLVAEPEQAHVHAAEEQRAVEDVEALELLAVDEGEDQRHQRDLEQRGHDAAEAGPHRPVGVELRAPDD